MPDGRFAGRRALVTGASRGIGAATAAALAAQGAHVAVVARTVDAHPTLPGSLRETAERLSSYDGRVVTIAADLAQPADRDRIVAAAVDGLGGPVEILVNNAAAAVYKEMADYPLDAVRTTVEVNVVAPLHLSQAVIPPMRDAGEGWIVNLSSATARPVAGPPYPSMILGSKLGVYGGAKAMLNRVTAALAQEVHGTGIRVNTVEPRSAVMSEGADALLGGRLGADQIETMEQMVAGVLVLCGCAPDHTGRNDVSLDLIAGM